MIAIHDLHRKMADVTLKAINENGILVINISTLQQLIPLLRQNLELVRKLDELKNLAYQAYLAGDMEWQSEICTKIDEIEATCV